MNYIIASYGHGDFTTENYLFECLAAKGGMVANGVDQECIFHCISGKERELTGAFSLNYALIAYKDGTAELFRCPNIEIHAEKLKYHVTKGREEETLATSKIMEDAPGFKVEK